MYIIPNYKPAEQDDKASEAQKSIARLIYATRISKDGKYAYRLRMGDIECCEWKDETRNFGSWWVLKDNTDFPQDTIAL